MSPKPVIPRAQACRDVDDAIQYFLREADPATASAFIDALETAYRHIGRHPETGSPRYAHELDLSDLRTWPLKRYPYMVFYMDRADHIDVWRVLHAQRDIPEWMNTSEDL